MPTRTLFFVSFLFAWCFGNLAAAQPNIVVLFIDDLDFDQVNVYDYREQPCHTAAREAELFPPEGNTLAFDQPRFLMPHLDRMAAEGARFDRFYVTSAVCTPARYGLLTGKYASRAPAFLEDFPPEGYGNLMWNVSISPDEPTVADRLGAAGYRTGFFGKWHNGQPDAMDVKTPEGYDAGLAYLREGFGFDVVDRLKFNNSNLHNLEWITEGAMDFMQASVESGQPFFSYVAIGVPHMQYYAHQISDDLRAIPTPHGFMDHTPEVMPSRESVFARVKAAGLPERNATATYIDDMIGALLGQLETLGVAENTLFCVISDHQSRGKFDNYEGARVPAVFYWPGTIEGGLTIPAISANIDLLPTLLELAGQTPTPEMDLDGCSLLPWLRSENVLDWRDGLLLEIHNSRAIVTERWKYIANRAHPNIEALLREEARQVVEQGGYRRIGWCGRENWADFEKGVFYDAAFSFPHYFDADQLYDLEADLFEQNNLANDPAHAATLAKMQALLREELKRLPHKFGEFTL